MSNMYLEIQREKKKNIRQGSNETLRKLQACAQTIVCWQS